MPVALPRIAGLLDADDVVRRDNATPMQVGPLSAPSSRGQGLEDHSPPDRSSRAATIAGAPSPIQGADCTRSAAICLATPGLKQRRDSSRATAECSAPENNRSARRPLRATSGVDVLALRVHARLFPKRSGAATAALPRILTSSC